MLGQALRFLCCPVCQRTLTAESPTGSVRCPAGHSYDVARPGYLPLLAGPLRHLGDPPPAVAARTEFLATGAYEPIATALATAVTGLATAATGTDGLVLDVGAGTGYYLARVLDSLPDALGLAVDVSKPALRRAARAHPRAVAVLADTWRRLPVADGAVGLLLNVFAPRNGGEFARVLSPGGQLLVVTPTPRHLAEVGATLPDADGVRWLRVDPEKPTRVAASLANYFRPGPEHLVEYQVALSRRQLAQLVIMSPSGGHTDPDLLAKAVAAVPEPLPVTISVRIGQYQRRAGLAT